MSRVLDLHAFIVVLLRGNKLTLEAMTVGGVLFLLACLNAGSSLDQPCRSFFRCCTSLLVLGALGSTVLGALVLHSSAVDFNLVGHDAKLVRRVRVTGRGGRGVFGAHGCSIPSGVVRCALHPADVLSLSASHAFARFNHRFLRLSFMALHRLATAAWIGCLPYMLIVLSRGDGETLAAVTRRFSRLAAGAVALLLATGLLLGRQYAGGVAAVYGTSYGVMLLTKGILFALLLLLCADRMQRVSRRSQRQWPVCLLRPALHACDAYAN